MENTPGQTRLSPKDYHVAWIAPGPEVALDPARLMLDEEHSRPDFEADDNTYIFGSMSGHNVVIATTPPGLRTNVNAGRLVGPMFRTFPNIKIVLLVGIGGGVPNSVPARNALHDIHLGDVMIGWTTDGRPAVVYYDSGISGVDGVEQHGTINRPDWTLLQALGVLESDYRFKKTKFGDHINRLLDFDKERYEYPGLRHDKLFRTGYHGHHTTTDAQSTADNAPCSICDTHEIIHRNERSEHSGRGLVFHKGRIGTGNTIIANSTLRDELSHRNNGIMCFEGSAAGVDASKNCLVIRGISDYCDAHKNGVWKHYAAGRAAVFAKELLCHVTPAAVERMSTAGESGEEIKTKLVKSLHFPASGVRYQAIRDAASDTGDWILQDYREWIAQQKPNTPGPFMRWMKGKAGSGKSTLMKLLSDHYAQITGPATIVIAFFFNARGEEAEKSVRGMYRSLLHQLLIHKLTQDLLRKTTLFTDPRHLPSSLSEHHDWTINELETFFRATIQALGTLNMHNIHCFVDALDESNERDIKRMVSFMASLRSTNLKLCFASRPYFSLPIQGITELGLDQLKEHHQDITHYIRDKLEIGDSREAQHLRQGVDKRASGIFLWAILVVEQLNTKYQSDPTQSIHQLGRTLHSLPQDLGMLFHDRLRRGAPVSEELILCFQFLLFCQRPLRPKELLYALKSLTQKSSLLSARLLSARQMTETEIKGYLEKLSKGLTEVISTRNGNRIQFIHESVRDFLLKDHPGQGLAELAPQLAPNIFGLSHGRLAQVCGHYIHCVAKMAPYAAVAQFAFFDYACHFVLQHSDIASGYNIQQESFLQQFPFTHWIKLVYLEIYHSGYTSSKARCDDEVIMVPDDLWPLYLDIVAKRTLSNS